MYHTTSIGVISFVIFAFASSASLTQENSESAKPVDASAKDKRILGSDHGGKFGEGVPKPQLVNWKQLHSSKKNDKCVEKKEFGLPATGGLGEAPATSDLVDWNTVLSKKSDDKRAFSTSSGDSFNERLNRPNFVNWQKMITKKDKIDGKRSLGMGSEYQFNGKLAMPQFVNWKDLDVQKRAFDGKNNALFSDWSQNHDLVNWQNVLSRKRAFMAADNGHFSDPLDNQKFVNWNKMLSKKRAFNGEGVGNFEDSLSSNDFVNWNKILSKKDPKDDKRMFTAGNHDGFNNNMENQGLVNWNSVLSKKDADDKRFFSQDQHADGFNGVAQNSPGLVNWNKVLSKKSEDKRLFPGNDNGGFNTGSNDHHLVNWNNVMSSKDKKADKRDFGEGYHGQLTGFPSHEDELVDWKGMMSKRAAEKAPKRVRRSFSLGDRTGGFGRSAFRDPSLVDWNSVLDYKRGDKRTFGGSWDGSKFHHGIPSMNEKALVNWKNLISKRQLESFPNDLGMHGLNGFNFQDWSDTFGRAYRSFGDRYGGKFGRGNMGDKTNFQNWKYLYN